MTPFQKKQLALMRQMESSRISAASTFTIVSMQKDYINDPQLCLTCVSFISKNIASAFQNRLIERLAAIEPDFYYYPFESLHVTIQNIRVINNPPHFGPKEIRAAIQLLSEVIPRYNPCTFTFSGVLKLPTSLAVIALITAEYDQFVRNLRQALSDRGIADDKKYFTDEIIFASSTVCRYTHKPSQAFLNEVAINRSKFFGSMTAKNITLIQTNAGAHPSKTKILGVYKFAPV